MRNPSEWQLRAVVPSGAALIAFEIASERSEADFADGVLTGYRPALEKALGVSLHGIRWSPETVTRAYMMLTDDLDASLITPHAFFRAAVEAGVGLEATGGPVSLH